MLVKQSRPILRSGLGPAFPRCNEIRCRPRVLLLVAASPLRHTTSLEGFGYKAAELVPPRSGDMPPSP